MDEKVFRFVAHTGFTHFEKGILWHERMYVFFPIHSFSVSCLLKRFAFFFPPLLFSGTATSFWERVSSTRAYDASFDCLYAQCSPVKEISGESYAHTRSLPLCTRLLTFHLNNPPHYSGPPNRSTFFHERAHLRLSHL